MKKRFIILTLILILILIPTNIFADNSLRISRWTIDSTLLENGDLSIIENITFHFNGSFNGVYRDIVLHKTDGIKGLSIFEMISDEEIEYTLDPKAKKGDNEVYNVDLKGSDANIIIFSPSKNESKTFRLKYTINNVAIKHKDIGELYYKFLGEENKTIIDYFSATINLPNFEKNMIKIFGHGPLNGKINFTEEDLIKLEVTDVPLNTYVEARILFPLDYIPNSTNIKNRDLEEILNEEISYEEKIATSAQKKEKIKNIFNSISLGVAALGVLIIGFLFNKFRRDPSIYENMDSIYPKDISPAELSLFMNQVVSSRAILATLFDLTRRGYISMDEIEIEEPKKMKRIKSEEKDFIFIKNERSSKELLEHEEFLINWLFNDIGDGTKVSTCDIENYRKKSLSNFSKAQSNWFKKVQIQLKSRNYHDPKGKKPGIFLMTFNPLVFVLGIFAIFNNALYGIGLIILSIALFIYGIFLFTRKSDEGKIQYDLWKDFKNNIAHFKLKDFDISEDQTLIYAIALGLPMEKLDDYRQSVNLDYYPMYWGDWYFLTNKKGGSLFEDRITRSFYGHTGTSSSTTSFGGGGGFSGGGGGGAGGGGAGGF